MPNLPKIKTRLPTPLAPAAAAATTTCPIKVAAAQEREEEEKQRERGKEERKRKTGMPAAAFQSCSKLNEPSNSSNQNHASTTVAPLKGEPAAAAYYLPSVRQHSYIRNYVSYSKKWSH